jgi:hypothetical protein
VGPALSFHRIDVDGGRVNFKQGDEKLPFAFVGVTGTVETNGPGRWHMDLEAVPWRAAVIVQQAGTIRLSGDMGGTSSRLRPASLEVSWTNASISDVLRLARGDDYGVRGEVAMALNARTHQQDDGWGVQGRAEFRELHRWDLALRPDNPSLNLIARMDWNPADPYIELTGIGLDAPASTAHASGRILWSREGSRERIHDGVHKPLKPSPVELDMRAAQVSASDLLAWVRAFHPGVPDGVAARGLLSARAEISGWPLRLVDAVVSGDGLDVSSGAFRPPAHLSALEFRYDRGAIALQPVALVWGGSSGVSSGTLRLDMAAKPGGNAGSSWHLVGNAAQMRDLVAGATAFGWNITRGWDVAGPFACDLRWPGKPYPWSASGSREPVRKSMGRAIGPDQFDWNQLKWNESGWIEFGSPSGAATGPSTGSSTGAALRAPFLNLPVEQIKARVELKPGVRHIALSSVEAFGAHWSGTFDRRESDDQWRFALSADRLAAAGIDRWLNPAWRESLLDRVLPFLNSRSPANAVPENLRASGRLTLDQFALAPLVVDRLAGDLKIEGRRIEFANATGQFYDGPLNGSLEANLTPTPSYHVDVDFSRARLPALIAALPSLSGLRAESATGQISLDARGSTRADLVRSLTCQGDAQVVSVELLNFDLWRALGGSGENGVTRFLDGAATFSCAGREIEFQKLSLLSRADFGIAGSGSIDFSRNLDLRFQVSDAERGKPGMAFRLSGPLADPRVAPAMPGPRRGR